ncbi:hypothetical protein [Siminovitchia fordii]|nr:hypothetical protein [Siminovitchia fordii]
MRDRGEKSDLLQVIEVYTPGENKEVVKAENRQYTHRRELLLIGKAKGR